MPKYDFLTLVFTKNEDEFKKYIELLGEKPYITRAEITEKNQAFLRTQKGKAIKLVRVEALMELRTLLSTSPFKLGDDNTEVVMTGTWYECSWIHPMLENLRDNNPGLKFRVANLKGTKPR